MSLDYQAKRRGVEDFSVNSAGASLLGMVHAAAGARMGAVDRAPYSATGKEAASDAKKVKALSDMALRRIVENDDVSGFWGGTPDEFVEWAREWQTWLRECGGYEAI